jgi:hypothetical protein
MAHSTHLTLLIALLAALLLAGSGAVVLRAYGQGRRSLAAHLFFVGMLVLVATTTMAMIPLAIGHSVGLGVAAVGMTVIGTLDRRPNRVRAF